MLFIKEQKSKKRYECSSVRQSIVRNSVLPTVDKGTQFKNENARGAAAEAELNLSDTARLS